MGGGGGCLRRKTSYHMDFNIQKKKLPNPKNLFYSFLMLVGVPYVTGIVGWLINSLETLDESSEDEKVEYKIDSARDFKFLFSLSININCFIIMKKTRVWMGNQMQPISYSF